jgi:uncharacterized cofD-like protein
MTRVVAIGGGHGLAQVLLALRRLDVSPTAVVTVADDGGSSGRLRRQLGIIALGDLRMALLALGREQSLVDLLAHRFERGDLAGHAVGNLLLLALTEQADGDVLGALRRAEALLRCDGSVLPSTTVPVQLSARIAGRRVKGQANVTSSHSRVDDLWLEPRDPPACPEAVKAVLAADVLVLGPGSLFTSIIANLLVPGLRRAVCDSDAELVHIANVQAQPGETAGLSLSDHVQRLVDALSSRALDTVVVHDGPPPSTGGDALRATPRLPGAGRIITADLLSREPDGRIGRAHDPDRLAATISVILRARASDSEPAGGESGARASDSEPASAGARSR